MMLVVPDTMVLVVVVGARLLMPLLIPRFPLPAIVGCLVIDAADQSIFQRFTTLDLDDYQTYDKALDVYYLALAYLSTIRNWAGGPDFLVGQALWYYRLIGVAIFEATAARWVLVVFANTFEYYFIAIELYRLARDPNRLTLRQVAAIAAVVWTVFKIPQEWWVHVARLDVTDIAKQRLFGVTADSSWQDALVNRPAVTITLLVCACGLVALVRASERWLGPREWPLTVDSDRQATVMGFRATRRVNRPMAFFGWTFVEKVVLVSLVVFVFGRILPGADDMLPRVIAVSAHLIAINTVLSQWLARRAVSWRHVIIELCVMSTVNLFVLLVTGWLMRVERASTRLTTTIVLIALLTLIVVLYDRFYAVFSVQQRQRLDQGAHTGPTVAAGR